MPASGIDAKAEFGKRRIPRARFFDVDAIADTSSDYPHMLPTPDGFAEAVSQLGVDNKSTVVCYDAAGVFSAPRAWWMFRVFGHDNVRVLNGGFPEWQAKGHPVERGRHPPEENDGGAARGSTKFFPSFRPELVVSKEEMQGFARKALARERQGRGAADAYPSTPAASTESLAPGESADRGTGDGDAGVSTSGASDSDSDERVSVVIDARSAGRFTGVDPEPREGLRGGHIPGSRSLPFSSLVDERAHSLWADRDILREKFIAHAGLDVSEAGTVNVPRDSSLHGARNRASGQLGRVRLVASCGSGMTACVLALGAAEVCTRVQWVGSLVA